MSICLIRAPRPCCPNDLSVHSTLLGRFSSNPGSFFLLGHLDFVDSGAIYRVSKDGARERAEGRIRIRRKCHYHLVVSLVSLIAAGRGPLLLASADPARSVAVMGSGLSDKSKYRETSNKALGAVNNLALVPFLMAFVSSRDRLPLQTVTSAGASYSFPPRATSDAAGRCFTPTKPIASTS